MVRVAVGGRFPWDTCAVEHVDQTCRSTHRQLLLYANEVDDVGIFNEKLLLGSTFYS